MAGRFEHIKGGIDAIILCSLKSCDKYGYEINREISENAYEIKPPTLYSYLKRLENDGLISSYWGSGESNGGRRRYYTLTELGLSEYENYVVSLGAHTEPNFSKVIQPAADSQQQPFQSVVDDEQEFFDEVDEFEVRFGGESEVDSRPYKFEFGKSPAAVHPLHVDADADAPALNYGRQGFDENIPPKKHLSQEEILNIFDRAAEQNRERQRSLAKQEVENRGTVVPNTSDVSENSTAEDDYRHVISELIGGHLADSNLIKTGEAKKQSAFSQFAAASTGHNAAANRTLGQHADTLAAQGYRLKIYNPDDAAYNPQIMLYKNKINFFSLLFTFLTAALILLGLWGIFAPELPFTTVAAFWATMAMFPVVAGAIFVVRPTKKVRPRFVFRYVIVNMIAAAVILIIIIFALGVLYFRVSFEDIAALLTYIAIPCIIALCLPLSVLYYKLLYKQMQI